MARRHLHFVDWMKSLGMFLIVSGHVAGGLLMPLTPPIYAKQLGVAFFIFVIGWGLARESRDRWQVVYNRLFPVFFLGGGFALVISIITFVTRHDFHESNYLPFFLGINVLMNAFPANPTTWYIGTYIHLILLWALGLRNLRVRLWMIVVAAAGEIVLRAMMLDTGALFRTYMLFPNWATVFLLGMFLHDQEDKEGSGRSMYMIALIVFLTAWTFAMRQVGLDEAFPFRNFTGMTGLPAAFARSTCITLLYVGYSWLIFEITRRCPRSALVAFFARHTVFIFIAHMPLFYALYPLLRHLVPGYWLRTGLLMLILYPGLALVSEVLMRSLQLTQLRTALWTRVRGYGKVGTGSIG